jgi:uncharacterized membrane protein
MSRSTSSVLRGFGQAALGNFLITTGVGHLTTKRDEFQAQVPSWFPLTRTRSSSCLDMWSSPWPRSC